MVQKRLHAEKIPILIQSHRHNPSPDPFVYYQLPVIIIREFKWRIGVQATIVNRTYHGRSPSLSDQREFVGVSLSIPDHLSLGGWQYSVTCSIWGVRNMLG